MQKGKKIKIGTLLDEIDKINIDIKNEYKEIYDFIYSEKNWPYLTIQKNKTQLYAKVEELVKKSNSNETK